MSKSTILLESSMSKSTTLACGRVTDMLGVVACFWCTGKYQIRGLGYREQTWQ